MFIKVLNRKVYSLIRHIILMFIFLFLTQQQKNQSHIANCFSQLYTAIFPSTEETKEKEEK